MAMKEEFNEIVIIVPKFIVNRKSKLDTFFITKKKRGYP